jgi:hypothetical protein
VKTIPYIKEAMGINTGFLNFAAGGAYTLAIAVLQSVTSYGRE